MPNVIISADSTCDLSPEQREHYQVRSFPFHIEFRGRDHLDNIDITPQVLFENASAAAADMEGVYVIDGKSLSTGIGLQVLAACRMRDAGMSAADIAREASDEIAERMRALQVVPNGLPEVVAQRNTLPTVPETIINTTDAEELAVAAINATVGTMRDVHEKVDAEDSASADILNDYIRRFEQQAWFIRSQNGQA